MSQRTRGSPRPHAVDRQRSHPSHSPTCPLPYEDRSLRRPRRRDERREVQVQASIEALNAAQAGTHVTFTQDAWEAIYKVRMKAVRRIGSSAGTIPTPDSASSCPSTTRLSIRISSRRQTRSPGSTIPTRMKKDVSAGSMAASIAFLYRHLDNNGDGVEHSPKETRRPSTKWRKTSRCGSVPRPRAASRRRGCDAASLRCRTSRCYCSDS